MRRRLFGMFTACLFAAGCGAGDGSQVDADEPVLQISSEGGFLPVEMALAAGPRFTLLGDGRLVYLGVQTMQYPGPLLPPYLVATLDSNQVNAVMAMVEDMGLADIDDETDDSAMAMVADASSEVIRFWDESGEHRFAVYALGLQDSPSERNTVLAELIATLDQFTTTTDGDPYVAERARVLAGPGITDPAFVDIREWPLESADLSQWQELSPGWTCTVLDGPVPTVFENATQASTWRHPDGSTEVLQLLVRPLFPGEPDCPA